MNELPEPVAGNEYDAILLDQTALDQTALRQSAAVAARTTPERAASVIKLSERTGIPKDAVDRNFDKVRARTETDYNDYDRMLTQSPKLTEWLKQGEGENFAVAKDDLENLGALEWMVTAPQRAWKRGVAQIEFGDLRHQSMFRDLSKAEQDRLGALRGEMQKGGTLGAESWFGKALTGGAQQLPMLFGGLTAGAETGAPMALTFGAAAAIAGQVGPQVVLPEEIITVPAAAFIGYRVGAATGAAQFTFKQEAGHAFEEFSKFKDEAGQPLDRDIARVAAVAAGAINAGLEVFQLETLMRTIPGADKLFGGVTRTAIGQALRAPTVRAALKELALGYGKTMTIEVTTEVAQRAITILAGELGKSVSGQQIERRKGMDIAADLANEGIEAAQAFTFLLAPGHVARLGQDAYRINQAKRQEQFFTALGEGVTQSKTFTRLPEKMQQFIEQATKDGPIENVYLPVQAWTQYFQGKGVDPALAAEEALGDRAIYETALQTDEDIAIPMARYASRIAATEANAVFAKELRLAPDQMNAREATEFEAKIAEDEKAAKETQEVAQTEDVHAQAAAQITESVRAKLVAAGTDESTAGSYAATYGAAFRQFGERAGVDPVALYERYGLTISRPQEGATAAPGETAMSQSAKYEEMFPLAGAAVDGRMVRKEVPNTSSIAASFEKYTTLPGIREVPLSAFDPQYISDILSEDHKLDDRTEKLRGEIAESGELNPLIVGVDSKGAYIIEGGHRFDALIKSGAKSIPALVALDDAELSQTSLDQSALPATIPVDGQDRSTTNSLGQPIAGTVESIENFYRWFGASKVVDAQGRPMVVYHGTVAEGRSTGIPFEEFDKARLGSVNEASDAKEGFWFTTNEMRARIAASDAKDAVDGDGFSATVMPLYLRIEKPQEGGNIGRMDSDQSAELIRLAKEGNHDGVIFATGERGGSDLVAFEPTQIKSAIGNRGTFDPKSASILYQSKVERDLIVQHNVTQANLLHALKLGGFPVPSLAIVKASDAMTNFGEITLIGPREMADPRGYARTRVFGSDVYSTRYPSIEYKFKDADLKPLSKLIAKHAALTAHRYFDLADLQKDGAKYLAQHPAVMAEFLESRGVTFERAIGPDSEARHAAYHGLRKAISDGELHTGLDSFAESLLLQMNPAERIFKGFTYSGNRSYQPHTLENVVRILKKDLRGGESESNIYGMGQLRSKFAPQFRSLSEISKAKDRIISDKEFDAVKKEVEGEFFAVVESLKSSYNGSVDPFRFTDTVMAVIEESATGLDRALKDFGFGTITDETREQIFEFVTRLRNMPTEYFEGKIMREVDLAEFKAAVVPEGVRPEVVKALMSRGVSVETYKKGNDQDRKRVIKELADRLGDSVMFQPDPIADEFDRAMRGDKVQGDTARGRIKFGADRQFSIELLQNANLSTFLHESGHFWLEVLGDIATELRIAPAEKLNDQQRRMLADYNNVLDFLNVQDRSEIKVEHHEKMARAFEMYFLEGKAPSTALRTAFARFRAWMMSVYRSLLDLNVTLTPEVRSVFDRMFASDQEIEAAQNEAQIAPMFTDAKSAGMSEIEFAAYSGRVQKASETARSELQAKLMRTLTREREQWWRAEREKERKDVAEAIYQRPEYIALSVLQRDQMPNGDALPYDLQRVKLSRKVIDTMYGEGGWKTVPRGTTAADGLHPNTVAELLGFQGGEALIEAIKGLKPMNAAIEQQTDAVMRQKHGDPMVDGTMLEAARQAVQNDDRVKVIEAEMRALAKLERASRPAVEAERKVQAQKRREGVSALDRLVLPLQTARDMAARRIASTRVRDIQPGQFLGAARRMSMEATKAAGKGDYTSAIAFKRKELINVELYRQGTQAREEVDQAVDYMQGFGEARTRGRIAKAGQDYLDQIDGFLDRYEFARVPLKTLDRRKNLAQWVADKERAGEPVSLPDDVQLETRTNYKDMTLEELRGVRDSVAHIAHLARLKNRLLTAKRQQNLDAAAAEIKESIETYSKGPRDKQIETRLPTGEAARGVAGWFGSHRKLSSFIRQMDGFKDGGALWEYVMRPMNAAADTEAVMNRQATATLAKLFEVYKGRDITALYAKQRIDAIGTSLTKMARLLIALNWGNADNRTKIMDGYKWNEQQVQAVIDTLDERDWKFVQGVWNFIGDYWPKIEAKEKRVNGVAPERVQAQTVMTKFGEFEGGYFPLKYDDRQSPKAHGQRVEEIAKQQMHGGYTRSTTRRGHTKERVSGVEMPIRLDFGVIFEHVTQVIHDLTHHEMLLDVNRVLMHKSVQGALMEHYGDVVFKQIQKTVEDVAAGDIPAQGSFEKSLGWVRSGVTISGMGWNVFTSMMQPFGLAQSMVRVGPQWIGRGLSRWMRDAASMENTATWIKEVSPLMKHRMDTQLREINEIRQQVGLNTGKFAGWVDAAVRTSTLNTVNRQAVVDSYFWLIYKGQQIADIPTWIGAYEKASADMENSPNGVLDEARVIALADQAVLDSQGGGQMKDLAAIQRGGPLLKLWTAFYSYFNVTYNLTVESANRGSFKDPVHLGRFAVDMFMLYTVPASLVFMLKHALVGPDDDDKYWEKLVRENLSYMFGIMVGLREIGSVMQGYGDYQGPAGTRFFASMGKLIKQVEQQEADAAFWRSLNETAGILLHYPAGQVKRTADGFAAIMEGETRNPFALLIGPQKER